MFARPLGLRSVIALAVALAVLPSNATPQGVRQASNELDRFRLFNGCEPMRLVVEDLPPAAAEIGLTRERIWTLAESRLRAARLYSGDLRTPASLYVNVNVVGMAFSVSLQYYKLVYDVASGLRFGAATWNTGFTGTHARNAGYIVQNISERLDGFLLQYLRVNEGAC